MFVFFSATRELQQLIPFRLVLLTKCFFFPITLGELSSKCKKLKKKKKWWQNSFAVKINLISIVLSRTVFSLFSDKSVQCVVSECANTCGCFTERKQIDNKPCGIFLCHTGLKCVVQCRYQERWHIMPAGCSASYQSQIMSVEQPANYCI